MAAAENRLTQAQSGNLHTLLAQPTLPTIASTRLILAARLCPFSQFLVPSSALLQKLCASVNYLTLRLRKKCKSLSAAQRDEEGMQNARVDGGNRRGSRDWPDVVGRRDVQLGPGGGRFGFGRDIAAC